jgi:predicted TIM-barrel fold metal-dependent hydrolase
LARRGLLLEVVSYFTQVPELVALLRAHPDLRVVIDHAAMPLHLDPWRVPFADAEAGWREAVRQLALLPNVHMKISGLWMAGRALTVDEVRPIVAHVLDCFGAGRCLVGSNFPVDRVNVSYREMMQTYLDCVADLDDDAVAALFGGNARALYGIGGA